jgi:hypothetical protein
MKKFYINNLEDLNEEEKRTNRVSYARLCDRLFDSMILCNNITDVDPEIFDNVVVGDLYEYRDNDGEYHTKEEYENDTTGDIYEEMTDIYQYFIVSPAMSEEYMQEHFGDNVILMYSEKLDNYILAVDHFGTSWTYVMTDLEPTTNFDEI